MFNFLTSTKRSLQDQLVLFGTALPCAFLLPFAFYRLVIGDYDIAAIDFMLSAGLITIFIQTWKMKKNIFLNTLSVVCFMLGVTWVISSKGVGMFFWAFPTIGFSYFVLKSKDALMTNALFIVGITFVFSDILTKTQALSIYPSLILVGLFGYAFSLCSERQNQKLLRRVSVDTLTGVENRRSFDEKVDEILKSYQRSAIPVSMLLLDLDYFKKINDTYGHKQGDQILTDFAQTVKSIIRTTDYVYRFGGEEFVVIANYSSLESSGGLAESIRKCIVQSEILSTYEVTVSIGVAEIIENDDADSWFRRADRALYESKAAGRNRVTLANMSDNDEIQFVNLKNTSDKKIRSIPPKTHKTVRSKAEKSKQKIKHNTKRAMNVLNIKDKL